MKLTRRQALDSAAILPLAAGATPTLAASHAEPSPLPTHRVHNLGDFKVVTLLAGSRAVPDPHTIFGLNVPDEEFDAVSEAAFLPNDNSQFFFTPTLVDTGEAKILFDTGLNPGGITAVAAHGHTPGHMAYMLDSGGKQMLLIADTANHAVWSLERPDWEVRFDMDKAAAAATRRKLLGMVAADRIPLIGYHLPFPAVGYVEVRGDGFAYVPASYQLML
ncbi:MAG: hypothetical protein GKR99_05420 [Rhodobacteraceae bacterium]|nr:hypothetical protein [Paracoccaceae bacterium]